MPPRIDAILETAVYVDDLAVAHAFYHGLLGLERMLGGERIHAYDVTNRQVLIVCLRGACEMDGEVGGAVVPGHRTDGPGHFAFRIQRSAYDDWLTYLCNHSIPIESEVFWPMGGKSLYILDPFSNVVELATDGIWPNDPIQENAGE